MDTLECNRWLNWNLSFKKVHLLNQSKGISWARCCKHPLQLFYLVSMSSFAWKTLIIMLWSDHVQSKGLYGFMFFKAFHLKDVNALPPSSTSIWSTESSASASLSDEWDKFMNLSPRYNINLYIYISYIDRDNHMTMFICISLKSQITPSTQTFVANFGQEAQVSTWLLASQRSYEAEQISIRANTMQHMGVS